MDLRERVFHRTVGGGGGRDIPRQRLVGPAAQTGPTMSAGPAGGSRRRGRRCGPPTWTRSCGCSSVAADAVAIAGRRCSPDANSEGKPSGRTGGTAVNPVATHSGGGRHVAHHPARTVRARARSSDLSKRSQGGSLRPLQHRLTRVHRPRHPMDDHNGRAPPVFRGSLLGSPPLT